MATGLMLMRYFYPLNEHEESCSMQLNGMTHLEHSLLFPGRSWMNTELISCTGGIWRWPTVGRKCVSGSQSGSARMKICFPACMRGDGNRLTALWIYYLIKHPLISKGPIFFKCQSFLFGTSFSAHWLQLITTVSDAKICINLGSHD